MAGGNADHACKGGIRWTIVKEKISCMNRNVWHAILEGGSKNLEDTRDPPSIYVGESARSLYKRSDIGQMQRLEKSQASWFNTNISLRGGWGAISQGCF